MTRVARKPIEVPAGVTVQVQNNNVLIAGPKGEVTQVLPPNVSIRCEGSILNIVGMDEQQPDLQAKLGTMRALMANHVEGVTKQFSKKLQLVGVGYRAQVQSSAGGYTLNLTLGFSHPVVYVAPKGITLLSSAVTEIEVIGVDKQKVGQVAAEIRGICGGLRKPEPYKGKGIRYADELIILKDTKKK